MKVFLIRSELHLSPTVFAAAVFVIVQLSVRATVAASEAAPPCHVELLPLDAPPSWRSAASSLQQVLRAAPMTDRDCRQVVIRAKPDGSSVEVTTRDGRRGVRLLSDAGDVQPTVTAMIVTVADELAVVDRHQAQGRVNTWHAVLVASAGARLTLPSTPAPSVAALVGVAGASSEFGLYGAWSPTVVGSTATDQAPFTSTAEVGISGAYRRPLHAGALLFGTRLAGIRISPTDNFSGTAQMTDTTDATAPYFAPAMSLFAGATIEVLSHLRLRPEISAQYIAPIATAASGSAPSLWSLGVSLGAESRVP